MLCEIFLTFSLNDGIIYITLSVPHSTVMDLNNVMPKKTCCVTMSSLDYMLKIYQYFEVGLIDHTLGRAM